MKHYKTSTTLKLCMITALIMLIKPLKAQIGCMDNSSRLKEPIDFKHYRYVNCNCPCDDYKHSWDRGICPQCRHFHIPKRFEFIKVEK